MTSEPHFSWLQCCTAHSCTSYRFCGLRDEKKTLCPLNWAELRSHYRFWRYKSLRRYFTVTDVLNGKFLCFRRLLMMLVVTQTVQRQSSTEINSVSKSNIQQLQHPFVLKHMLLTCCMFVWVWSMCVHSCNPLIVAVHCLPSVPL